MSSVPNVDGKAVDIKLLVVDVEVVFKAVQNQRWAISDMLDKYAVMEARGGLTRSEKKHQQQLKSVWEQLLEVEKELQNKLVLYGM